MCLNESKVDLGTCLDGLVLLFAFGGSGQGGWEGMREWLPSDLFNCPEAESLGASDLRWPTAKWAGGR